MTVQQPLSDRFPSRAKVRERGYPCTPAEKAAIEAGQEQWLVENEAAIESSNRWVEKYGLPLAKYRMC